jgi:spore coat polysaccharide biosynthesis protein SpsF (cytidylyltransferase family)
MGSTRLPGKVLADIAGRSMLEWVLTRVARAAGVNEVVVATTTLTEDNVVQESGDQLGVRVVRADPFDVLGRYVVAAREAEADVVVRVTADCPFIDPELITSVVERVLGAGPPIDYVSNTIEPRTFPRGLDVEAMTRRALLEADRLDSDPESREHVTPFIRESGRFLIASVTNDEDVSAVRWTVDTAADLELVRRMADAFGGRDTVTWRELLQAWRAHPDWWALNAHVAQRQVRGGDRSRDHE